MTALYVREQNSEVRVRAGRMLVKKEEAVFADLPLEQVRQIVLFGSVSLSPAVVAHCLRSEIDVCFLTMQGRFKGRLCGEGGTLVRLRQAQYRKCADEEWVQRVAQSIVAGKIRNKSTFLARRFSGRSVEERTGVQDTGTERAQLADLQARAKRARKLETLRGLEGTAARVYFEWFGRALPEVLGFSGVRDRPARDPVNSAFNLGYTLLYQEMLGALHLVGLDPYLGCLHQPQRDHAALASDLIEEFRAVVVDSLVMGMAQRGELRPDQFHYLASGEARFTEEGLAHFLTRYEERMSTVAMYTPRKARFPYRKIIEWQVRHFADVVMGEAEEYVGLRWDY